MARAKRRLNPAVEALVQERLKPNECIQGWIEFRPGENTVRLIDKDLHRVVQQRRFSRGAGCGRSLLFVLKDGQWCFMGVGGWIS
jgi:hypothetical protein